jgi:hypothetical protein
MMLLEETPLYRAQWLWETFPRMRQVISRAIAAGILLLIASAIANCSFDQPMKTTGVS